MKITWPKAKKYNLAQQRKFKKLAEHCMSHYPKDSDLHKAVKGCFGAFEDFARKHAKVATKSKTTVRRKVSRRRKVAKRAAPKRRTTAKRRAPARRKTLRRRTTARRRTAPRRRTRRAA
jgi:hypothetical protein